MITFHSQSTQSRPMLLTYISVWLWLDDRCVVECAVVGRCRGRSIDPVSIRTAAAAAPLALRFPGHTSAPERLEEVLLEAVVHETVDDGIDAAVAVAEQLKEGHGNAERVMLKALARFIEQQIDLDGEEGEPTDGEHYNDDDQHPHDALLLSQSSVRLSLGVGARLSDRTSAPQLRGDRSVGGEHRDDWEDVEDDVEDGRVGDGQAVVAEVLGADGDQVHRLGSEDDPWLQTLDKQLRNYEKDGHGPDG